MIELGRKFGRAGAATLLAGLCAVGAHGQDSQVQSQADAQAVEAEAAPSEAAAPAAGGETVSLDAFDIPEDVVLLGTSDPNKRHATATVNGTIITGTDIEQRVALILAANDATDVPEEEIQRLRLQVLRNLIDETLQIQEAEAQEIAVTPPEVAETYQRVAAERYNMTPEEMDRYLRSVGSSPNSLKRQIEGELAWNRLLQRNVAPFVSVSSEEANELYQRLQASKGAYEYRVGEIFLSTTPQTRDAVAETARRIVEQIRQGGSFVAYARQFSEASTAAVGGDLGWIRVEQLQNPQLEEIVKQLSPGQLVGPVEIPGGIWIGYLIDQRQIGMADPRDALLSLKQIAIDFAPGTTEDQARERANAFAQAVQQIHGCGEADAAAAAFGAQVVDNDIRLRDAGVPEQLQAMLLGLQIGEATPPFGALDEGVRVLMLCGRDDPASEAGPTPEQILAQMEDERVGKRAQRYLRDLRRDAVIEYK